ncbi:IS1 family transposase, partial [Escherichia coli]
MNMMISYQELVRTFQSTAGHQRYLCSHCRKTWQL